MCGVLGIAAVRGRRPSLDDGPVAALRDRMRHRGPDGAGLWRRENVVLAHRRLAVIDLSPAAAQPMVTPDGLCALVYNGEVYNDAALRAGLGRGEGAPLWRSRSDSETLLHLLAQRGAAALGGVRGMYALGFFDARAQRLTLARDPLGIKPLYYAVAWAGGAPEVVFASEAPVVASHPGVGARPDLAGISAYLSTIRAVLGDRTLFAGVRALRAGEVIEFDLGAEAPRSRSWVLEAPAASEPWDGGDAPGRAAGGGARPGSDAAGLVRRAVEESVRVHLRSDAPLCVMLSGGLDSTIIAAAARRHHAGLRSYCSGAAGEGEDGDAAHARRVAREFGLRHAEAPVSAGLFDERWGEMVARSGQPLSTPNEVAINEVARRMRAAGEVVALSGEGADELFGGYGDVLGAGAAFEAARPDAPGAGERAAFFLGSASWVSPAAKAGVLSAGAWRSLEGDAALLEAVAGEFAAAAGGAFDAISVHLRFLRRVNLTGLLLRLDSATMLESIEGRTPFADARVAALAEALPAREKFVAASAGGTPETKGVLRRAFAAEVPAEIAARPKASFPLPFRDWMGPRVPVLKRSALIEELFSPGVTAAVAADPARHWHLAWPMINLAMWWERWG